MFKTFDWLLNLVLVVESIGFGVVHFTLPSGNDTFFLVSCLNLKKKLFTLGMANKLEEKACLIKQY